jgi:uncharacterized protein YukE
MASQVDRLQAMAARLDRQIDQRATAYQGQLAQALRAWQRQWDRDVAQRTDTRGRMTTRPAMPTRTLARAWQSGPEAVAERGAQSLSTVGANVIEGLRSAGISDQLSAQARRAADAAYRLTRDELIDGLDRLLSDIGRATQRAQSVKQSADRLQREIDDLITSAVTRSRRQYETALATFAQTLLAAESDADDAFLYVGPIDRRCRNFCLAHVGRVVTREAIDQMDNGQMPNVFLTRGGYNCRHLWHPVKDPALAALANTRRYAAPQLQSAVSAARRAIKSSPLRRTA